MLDPGKAGCSDICWWWDNGKWPQEPQGAQKRRCKSIPTWHVEFTTLGADNMSWYIYGVVISCRAPVGRGELACHKRS